MYMFEGPIAIDGFAPLGHHDLWKADIHLRDLKNVNGGDVADIAKMTIRFHCPPGATVEMLQDLALREAQRFLEKLAGIAVEPGLKALLAARAA